jgi:hypothetical protein
LSRTGIAPDQQHPSSWKNNAIAIFAYRCGALPSHADKSQNDVNYHTIGLNFWK